jgi:hypothetical protein
MKKVFDSQFGFVIVSALLVFAFSALTSQAQITRGTISGTVRDESGAVVSGAQVTITSTRTWAKTTIGVLLDSPLTSFSNHSN